MTNYTVAIATYYNGAWHADVTTESAQISEQEAIKRGHELSNLGAFPLYTEYVDNQMTCYMVEYNGHLERAFGL